MAEVELIMPKMGESIMEATILKWLKKEGDKIALDEPLLEIATDKVDSEVPSTHAGVLTKILYNVNDVVPVGKPIAIIQTDSSASTKVSAPVSSTPQEIPSKPEIKSDLSRSDREIRTPQSEIKTVATEGRFYSPLVLNIARSEGIAM